MAGSKLTISYDEVNSDEVEQRIRRQEERARAYQPPPPPTPSRSRQRKVLYNTALYTAFFGLIGGLLGWACGALLHFRPDHKQQASELLAVEADIRAAHEAGKILEIQARASLRAVARQGENNPYYQLATNTEITPEERTVLMARLDEQEAWAQFIANVLFYSVAGMTIATCLAIADAVVERNTRAAIINGSVGAALGLVGGIVVSLLVDQIYTAVVGEFGGAVEPRRQMMARAASWGVLGVFLALAPGLVMRNVRKLGIGLVGGALGGVVGGLLFDPLAQWTGNLQYSRLAGMMSIGLITGLSIGLIENIAKSGWLKVTAGLIAGKQFVLYRNPTYIGSSLACSIYLFKDPQVGPRHAAVHLLPGGFELEDLPLGTPTLVNGKPVTRVRLRDGDVIQIGSTELTFHEKKAK